MVITYEDNYVIMAGKQHGDRAKYFRMMTINDDSLLT
jgi:hypothetical protein